MHVIERKANINPNVCVRSGLLPIQVARRYDVTTTVTGGWMMSVIALQLEYAVEADVSRAFAWQFRTDVSNWNDPPAQFALEGPFEAGTRGTTLLPDREPVHWLIREVRHGESFVVEMPLDRATLTFEWYFDRVSEDRTKLTQRIVLSGDNAGVYTGQVEAGFGANLADGMRRIAAEMAAAEKRSKSADSSGASSG
jgi:hypothetical protein